MNHIRYANCWEDAETVLAGLDARAGGDYCSIASAGDIVLALLSRAPHSLTARDMNPAQTALLELRAAAIAWGARDEVMGFLGVRPSRSRRESYRGMRDRLSPSGRTFWDDRPGIIRRGIIHAGRVERYFRLFRRFFLPVLLNRKKREALESSGRNGDADLLIARYLGTPEWRLFIRFFFHPRFLRRLDLGRKIQDYRRARYDPELAIRPRLARALTNLASGGNQFLDYITSGNFKTLPYYLRPDVFPAVRKHLAVLRIQNGEIRSLLARDKDRMYDGIYLSDIFEYMDEPGYRRTMEQSTRHLKPGGRIVYWNNLFDRDASPAFENLRRRNDLAAELFARRQAFFYRSLTIMERP